MKTISKQTAILKQFRVKIGKCSLLVTATCKKDAIMLAKIELGYGEKEKIDVEVEQIG